MYLRTVSVEPTFQKFMQKASLRSDTDVQLLLPLMEA